MRQKSLRLILPLLFACALLGLGAASLWYAQYHRQQDLTEESRVSLLGDVARLARLADQGWPAEVNLISADLAQIACRPQVVAAFLLADNGKCCWRIGWRGEAGRSGRLARVGHGSCREGGQRRMPD